MYYLGVDLGGFGIVVGLVDKNGNIVVKESTPTKYERGADAVINDIAMLCKSVMEKGGASLSDVVSIGLGCPGSINTADGVIEYANNLRFENVNVRSMLSEMMPLPIYIDNDANCAALGENFAGAAKGCKSSVTITLGTGVGGGIIIDGKIISGAFGGGGEIGHHVIVVGGESCTCGRLGCFEAYCAATAIVKLGQANLSNKNGKIYELVGGDPEKVEAKTVFDACDMGDADAVKIVDDYIIYLAEGTANMINILQPEAIVFGGGVSNRGHKLIDPLYKLVNDKVYGLGEMKTKLVVAELGNDAGIIGAAILGLV